MKSIVFVVALVVIGLVVCISLLRSEHRKENSAMNSLMVIVPYKYEGLWVFDDAAVGLFSSAASSWSAREMRQ